MSRYRKGYRREKQAREFMEQRYGCVCIESRGSHGAVDLICGNGLTVYVIQVKNPQKAKYVNWAELWRIAKHFKAVPLVMSKKDYGEWTVDFGKLS